MCELAYSIVHTKGVEIETNSDTNMRLHTRCRPTKVVARHACDVEQSVQGSSYKLGEGAPFTSRRRPRLS